MINRKKLSSLMVGAAILLVANVSTFAGGSANVNLSLPASLNGVKLNAGSYNVKWESHSPEATVTFSKGSKVLATVGARVEERDVKYDRDMVLYRTNPDGSYTITEIRFAGKRQVLVFGN
jgi:hypothetical protein